MIFGNTCRFGFLFVVGMLLLVFGVGCRAKIEKVPVEGNVSFEGNPLPTGDILFFHSNPDFGPEAGKIENGRYACLARPGKNRVEITAAKIIPGGALGGGGEPVPEDYLPERYNRQTELSADVELVGENRFNFELRGEVAE